MKCKNCPYWQGIKYSEWGDCYRVLSEIEPELLTLTKNEILGDEESPEIQFTVPFDPHDVSYWHHLEEFVILYAKALSNLPNLGIRKDYDKQHNCYIQTHKDYVCRRETI